MIINRVCQINPVEPEFLSFRLSSGIETKIDFFFKKQNGAPHGEDLVAQLQLTSRTRDTTEYYSVPATDVVNGRARATIPAQMTYDPNGWRLRLTGTVDTEPRVLAYGVVTAVAGAGPQVEPQDVIDTIPLSFQRDEEVNLNVTLWADASKSAIYDLTAKGTTINAYVFGVQGGPVLVPFTTTALSSNVVNLYLTADQVNNLPDACWWSLIASTGAGTTTLCEGPVAVSGVVKPPFTDVIANYDYHKQDALVAPATGQIIHANYALDVIRMHIFDADGTDRSATINDLMVGDQILIELTTWSITSLEKAGADWWAIYVAPAQQAVPGGLQPVTFRRP
jgi:hypothetical protein